LGTKKISGGASRGRRALPNVNLGPPAPFILETTRERKLNLKTQLAMDFGYKNFAARGVQGAQDLLMKIRDSLLSWKPPELES